MREGGEQRGEDVSEGARPTTRRKGGTRRRNLPAAVICPAKNRGNALAASITVARQQGRSVAVIAFLGVNPLRTCAAQDK